MKKVLFLSAISALSIIQSQELPFIFKKNLVNNPISFKQKSFLIDGSASSQEAREYAKKICNALSHELETVFNFIEAKSESLKNILEEARECVPCVVYVDIHSLWDKNILKTLDEIDKTDNILFIIHTQLPHTHICSSLFREGRLRYLDITQNAIPKIAQSI